MQADVILNEKTVLLNGDIIVTPIEKEITVGGGIAGYGFRDRTYGDDRYVLYADEGTARIYKDEVGDLITIDASGSFVNEGKEVDSKGALAGFGFADRSHPDNRYVLYADENKAFIWNSAKGNILTIDSDAITCNVNAQTVTAVAVAATTVNSNTLTSESLETKILTAETFKADSVTTGSINSDNIMTSVIEGKQISLKGKLAEYAFFDRDDAAKRFVMYANDGKIRFYMDGVGDVLTISGDKTLTVENISAKTINADSVVVEASVDVLSALQPDSVVYKGKAASEADAKGGHHTTVVHTNNPVGARIGDMGHQSVTDRLQPVAGQPQKINLLNVISDLAKRIAQLESRLNDLKKA